MTFIQTVIKAENRLKNPTIYNGDMNSFYTNVTKGPGKGPLNWQLPEVKEIPRMPSETSVYVQNNGMPNYPVPGSDTWWTRIQKGVSSRGREIIAGVVSAYTMAKVVLTSDAATVLATGGRNPYLLPALFGALLADTADGIIPCTYNEVTGKWETGEQVVTNYFLPGQIAKFTPGEDPNIAGAQWFRNFLENAGIAYDDYLKAAGLKK
jgi:hypothetical protein